MDISEKKKRPPVLEVNSEADTVTVYMEPWWDDEYMVMVALTLDMTEKLIGRELHYNFTYDKPPDHVVAKNMEMVARVLSGNPPNKMPN